MNKYIYLVSISQGRNNNKYKNFLRNVQEMGAISLDYSGINNMCLLSSSQSQDEIHSLCTVKVKKSDVTVEEITKETLNNEDHVHHFLKNTINNFYIGKDTYPNIEENEDN